MATIRFRSILSTTLLLLIGCLAVLALNYLSSLNNEIKSRFDGKRWSLPAVVYARPLELYPGLKLQPDLLEKELQLAGYRNENPVKSGGGYHRQGNTLTMISRKFAFPSGTEPSNHMIIRFLDGQVRSITHAISGDQLSFVRLAPARIGSFHPLVHEDRLVLKPEDIPVLLKRGLMTVEDKQFYSHHGVSPSGIVRALFTNIKAGRAVQGGSTLTQQLIKNLFLGRERTLSRKAQEALMALLLEYNYSKEEILAAYINEVFLGQDGSRAVHGFGLASQFFFRRELDDLSTAKIATLIGMVKGPSYYDPRKNSDNCLARRNVVLGLMKADNIISEEEYARSITEPLTDVVPQKNGFNRFPAFLDLVRRQLKSDYREDDLKSDGLKILTTLDPQIQWTLEEQLARSIKQLKMKTGQKQLESAVIITGRETGEILGIAGGTTSQQSGFNRALDSRRPIGSLIKPAIFLSALTHGYTLASPILDSTISIEHDGTVWKPENYNKIEHGKVALYTALAKSYNLATVRLGMDIGLQDIITTMRYLGYSEQIKPYPSLLLGSVNMSPLQVSQMYQTIGSGGFYQPQRAIRNVLNQENQGITSYGLKVDQRFSPEHMYLLNHALERVMEEGTGSSLNSPTAHSAAGKTGTSNDLRDSWFAGYSDNYLTVVWLGNDDNSPTGLSGPTGALPVWGKIMENLEMVASVLPEPENITWTRIDLESLTSTSSLNRNSTLLPFISGTEPVSSSAIPGIDMRSIEDNTRRFFDSINNIFR